MTVKIHTYIQYFFVQKLNECEQKLLKGQKNSTIRFHISKMQIQMVALLFTYANVFFYIL